MLYDVLRQAIVNGEYRPGAILGETQLAERYHVSRTPVREALRRLEQDGVVERAGRQLRVTVTGPEAVLDIYECRIVLEALAAEWAAGHRTDLDLAMVESALSRMTALSPQVPVEMVRHNHDFHAAIWAAAHNDTLRDLLARLDGHVLRYPEPTVSQPGRWREVLAEHRAILDAVAAGDRDAARQAAATHLRRARDVRLGMLSDSLVAEP